MIHTDTDVKCNRKEARTIDLCVLDTVYFIYN